MIGYVAFAVLGLMIGVLWVVRGRQIARLRREIRDLRAYIAHLDEADRLSHIAPGGEVSSSRRPRRRRHLSVVPVALVGVAGGLARRVWSDPVVAGSVATAAIAGAVVCLAVVQAPAPPYPEAGREPPAPASPPLPSPAAGPSSKPTPRPPTPVTDTEVEDDEEPPPVVEDPRAEAEPPARPEPLPTSEPDRPDNEPAPEVLDLDLLDELVRTRVDLGGAAPEPPTLLGKAREESRAVRHRVSEIATEPGQRQANTA
jgi:hypothetical protein